jgi:PAS domain S-box-containing protein
MRIGGWPRSIRFQLLAGLVLLEALSLVLFGTVLIRKQSEEMYDRAQLRLDHQATSMTLQSQEAFKVGSLDMLNASIRMMGEAPSVEIAKVTDPSGKVLGVSDDAIAKHPLSAVEKQQIGLLTKDQARVFSLGGDDWESVKAIYVHDKLYGYAWVETDQSWDHKQITLLIRSTSIFGGIWIGASILLAWILGRSITGPLAVLHRGTRALMQSPESHANFPLPVTVHNEIGDLIEAFNRMVASIEEQRSGLSDTLSLLDSMLANAPIGLAFFDRRCRFVRVNRIFAETTGIPLSRHLGRTLPEVLPSAVAHQLEKTIEGVFEKDEPVRDVELTGTTAASARSWTWIASAYPIRTTPNQVRWVGLIVMDASDRKRSEEALRKTEKLAATGRLAASIAHEINNPLEAITNLLYLLINHAQLEEPALGYAMMADHEVRRISEITQQTLRFYRQSTLPTRTNLADILDSVMRLYQGRVRNLGIQIDRKYDASIDLYCFAGEVRQVFANLIGNAIDAMPDGGKLTVRARRSRDWRNPDRTGVRFQVADTGSGMLPGVQKHIFEAFFTTKEVTGTGLGLWVSSEIVAKHHGTVKVRSWTEASGRRSGTAFELFFPDEPELTEVPEAEAQAVSSTA